MRSFLFYLICIVLFLACMWGVKLFLTNVSDDFRNGFVLGMVVIVVLIWTAEKLGYKEPRY
ncbi:hypothetical protein JQ594_05245 [Bradyrhizobium manausense]|uniref:hypothetical protein n=1 Tax=Bradyrhizobium manausense TaxID=989370 RepID=UPI001BA4E641|nr:hypothetical protein [Bradyrhizobium manausense]MBR0685310.1 hypothetical protein [Bradyrhizobium manausense]